MQAATKHPAIRCNASERGEACGHVDALVGRPATVLREGHSWSGRIEWIKREEADPSRVESAALRCGTETRHFGLDDRTTLLVS